MFSVTVDHYRRGKDARWERRICVNFDLLIYFFLHFGDDFKKVAGKNQLCEHLIFCFNIHHKV